MIISKTPLRVSLFGGGSDYPTYINRNRGVVVGGTIDKYIYITANKLSSIAKENIRLCYRVVEACNELDQISHPIVREYLKLSNFTEKYGFYTISDIPGGSGLGSSSSFSVGFIKLIDFIKGHERSASSCAQEAINLEQNILKEPVGVQDQYHAAIGGFGRYDFWSNEYSHSEFNWSPQDYQFFNERVCLVHTGGFRNAKDILIDQQSFAMQRSKDDYLLRMVEIAETASELISNGLNRDKIVSLAELLNESWQLKQSLSTKISNQNVSDIIELGRSNGALGAKLLGAGGEGFVMFLGNPDCFEKMARLFGTKRTLQFKFGNYRAGVQKIF